MFAMQLALLSNLPARRQGGTLSVGESLASHGPEVIYREVTCRNVLGRSPAAEKMGYPFSWTVNPYRGCEIGCTYCYARATHEYLGADPQAFENEIFVKLGAERTVARALRPEHFRNGNAGGAEIAIGTVTDPYQPAERRYRLTRRILERLVHFSGLTLSVTTKSPLVTDDAELLGSIARKSDLTVHMSLISLDADLLRHLEPKGATPEARLSAIARLTAAGVRVGLFIMPLIPGLNDDPAAVRRLEAAARSAGAAFVVRQRLSLRDATWPTLEASLREHYPEVHRNLSRRMLSRSLRQQKTA
ncbi:MAG: radical SAM protein [Nitrospirota bacterium]|nr:radical SAM protein [Nitrospirota bacterium]